MLTELATYRVVFEFRKRTRRELLRAWCWRVWDAMTEPLEREVPVEVRIGPDDPRWDSGLAVYLQWINIGGGDGPNSSIGAGKVETEK